MKRLLFLRHTITAYNQDPVRLRGDLDIPLAPEGYSQIPEVVRHLQQAHPDVKAVYSSPLSRVGILATAVAHEYGLAVQKLDALKSWSYGVLNGRRVDEVLDVLKVLGTGSGRELAPKGGESMNDFLHRVAAGMKMVIAEAPEEGCVVVCSHLQNLMMSKAYLEAGLPEDAGSMEYEYREANEIAPGTWFEMKREWIRNGR